VTRGTSRSRTDGTSETLGTSTSETVGQTSGTSQSRTAGAAETIQKRALITPDEIGQVFARIDDRAHPAYPGLALVVISGAHPVPVRRVNYYEDFQFMELFDPHPDYPFVGPKELTVEAEAMGVSLAQFGLRIGGWSIKPSQFVAGGDEAAVVITEKDTKAASIRIPHGGLIKAVQGNVLAGPLFSELYYEDGAPLVDPFAELKGFCNQVIGDRAAQQRQLAAKKRSRKYRVIAAVACCVLVAVVWGVVAALRPAPFMVGRVNVSHFAGMKAGDTEAEVASLYGPALAELGSPGGASVKFYVNKNMMVTYNKDGIIKSVMLRSSGQDHLVRSRAGDDALLDLFGRPKDYVVALLGPPKRVDSKDANEIALFWSFPMHGRPGDNGATLDETTDQTLTLGFGSSARCEFILVRW